MKPINETHSNDSATQNLDNKHYHAPKCINAELIAHFHKSHIILTHDFESEKNLLCNSIESEFLRIFESQEIKIDDAHNIIKEAYITSDKVKTLAIFASSYNHFAQNALLKILEEPPKHILFILYAHAKNRLLPTIFSRLVVFDKRKKIPKEPFPLNISKLNVPIIYEYMKSVEKENYSSEQGRDLVARLLDSVARSNKKLNQYELERFDKAMESLQNKQNVHLVLLPLLLSLIPK